MFEDILKNLRKEKGFSQEELAKKLFVKRYVVANWEQGRCEPSMDDLRRLCVIFDISADEILELDTKTARSKVLINNSFNNSKNINLKL